MRDRSRISIRDRRSCLSLVKQFISDSPTGHLVQYTKKGLFSRCLVAAVFFKCLQSAPNARPLKTGLKKELPAKGPFEVLEARDVAVG